MDSFSEAILSFVSGVPLVLQLLLLGVFSFTEGLPIIGSVLPGGTIALFAGSLAAQGILSPFVGALVVGTASFAGDMFGFLLGRKFRHLPRVSRFVTHEKYQRSWDLFDRHLAIVSIFGKLLPVIRSTPSLFAAIRGVRTRRYMIYSFIGSYLWGFLGIYAGNVVTNYLGPRTITLIFVILVTSIVIILLRTFIKRIWTTRR
ncbi:MAG: VTT domain-containing protein [Candidatus Pacebacteria bacterium]|jgi:membrane protein DedA with SNARE-associated domain|nr:VTT domain-containing protein [Candidatus Paceibacterota bacterium]